MNRYVAKYGLFLPTVILRGEPVFHYLKRYQASQWEARQAIDVMQQEKLKSLLNYAKENVPYYSGMLNDNNLSDTPVNLNAVPLLTKEILKDKKSQLISTEKFYLKSVKTTGGSTGEPVTVYKESKAMAMERAALWRGYGWAGVGIGDKQCRFWGIPLKFKDRLIAGLIDFINNRMRISAFDFNEQKLKDYYSQIQSFRPKYLYGYVSMIRILGQYMLDRNLPAIDGLKCIITTAEELTDDDRLVMESAFGKKVFNEYGSGEVGTIAHECEAGNLHICAENVLVEILKSNGELARPGEMGELVVTELNGRMLPLIRYRVGDLGTITDELCPCGRELPVLAGVFGRAYDVVSTPEGKSFHPAFFNYIFKEVKKKNLGVKQFQVVQTGNDALLIRLVPEMTYSEKAEELLRALIRTELSPRMTVTFKETDRIPRERSGKIRVVKGLAKEG